MNFAIAIQELDKEIAKLQRVRAVLVEAQNGTISAPYTGPRHANSSRAARPKRVLSAAAKERIAAAQRARWAKWHRTQK